MKPAILYCSRKVPTARRLLIQAHGRLEFKAVDMGSLALLGTRVHAFTILLHLGVPFAVMAEAAITRTIWVVAKCVGFMLKGQGGAAAGQGLWQGNDSHQQGWTAC